MSIENSTPSAQSDTFSGNEDTNLVITPASLLANDLDADGDILTISSVGNPLHGTVVINAAGNIVFRAAANYFGPASFEYTVTDGLGGVSTAVVNLTIAAVNDVPRIINPIADQLATEDAPFSFVVPSTAFKDADLGDTLAMSATLEDGGALPAWLTFDSATRTFSGTPPNAQVGSFSVKVTATDAAGAFGSDVFTLTVANTNDAPVVANLIANQIAAEDALFSFTLPADVFKDVDVGDVLTLTARLDDGNPLPAWLTFDPATRTFSGIPPGAGSFYIRVTATDSTGATVADVFALGVAGINDAPDSKADLLTVRPNTALTISAATLLGNDRDEERDALSITSLGNAVNGTVVRLADGSIVFTPVTGFIGTAGFEYTVSDGKGGVVTETAFVVVQSSSSTNTGLTYEPEVNIATDAGNEDVWGTIGLAGGGFVVAWFSSKPGTSDRQLNGRYFDASGVATGSEFVITESVYQAGGEWGNHLRLAALDDGGFVATYVMGQPSAGSTIPAGVQLDESGAGVYAQRISADGIAVGKQFLINSAARAGIQDGQDLVQLSDGRLIATWFSEPDPNLIVSQGYAQIFDATGVPQGGTFALSATNTYLVGVPQVRALPTGGFISTWAAGTWVYNSTTGMTLNNFVEFQIFDAQGNRVGAQTTVSPYDAIAGNATPSVTVLADGGFVVTWGAQNNNGSEFFFGQRYNAGGGAMGARFTVANDDGQDMRMPWTVALADGGFMAYWELYALDGTSTVMARRFDTDANPIGAEFVLKSATGANSIWRSFAPLENGDVAAVWSAYNPESGSNDLHTQIYNSNFGPLVRDDTASGVENAPIIITQASLLANDRDYEGGALTVTRVKTPVNGTVAINAAGDIVFRATANYTGPASFEYVATDSDGASSTGVVTLNITGTPDAPILSNPIANQTAIEDAAFSFVVPASAFTDPDVGDTLTLSASLSDGTALPSWLSFNAATRTFSGTPGNANVGSLSIKVTATDSTGLKVSDVFSIAVSNTNDAPIVNAAIADQTAAEDAAFSFVVPATAFKDVDVGDTFTLSASLADGAALPAWLSFDAATRTFSGTPGNAQVGTLAVTVTATDVAGASVSDVFNLQVTNTNDAPTVNTALADQSATEDSAFSFVVPATAFKDIDVGDTMTFTASLEDGAPLPTWLVFNAATRTFSGTPRNVNVGNLSIKVTATDGAGLAVSDVFAVAVSNTNDAPVVNVPIADQTAAEDAAFNFVVPATAFREPDVGDTLTLSATLAGGTPLPAWLTFNAATRTFSGTPGNAQVGTIAVTVTATDAAGTSASDVFNLQVTNTNDAPIVLNAIADQTIVEDVAFSFVVPATVFKDVDVGDTLTLSATLENGNPLPAWLSFNAATRTFSGTPGNANVGAFSLSLTATDAAGATVSDVIVLNVSNTNDAPILLNPIPDQTTAEDALFTYVLPADAFSDVDAGDTLTLSATLVGGAALPGWLTFNAATRSFSGTPRNGHVGPLSVRVKATDAAGASISDVFVIQVTNTNDAPIVANAIADQVATEDAAFSYTVPANAFTDVDAGDTFTLSATLSTGAPLPAWLSFNAATRTFSGTPENANVGTLSLKVTATDAAGARGSDIFVVQIANTNDAPILANAIADQSAIEGNAFNFVLPANAFSDVDAGDVLTLSATLANGTALPSWLAFNAATRSFSGTPGTANIGALSIKVTATDSAGASASDVFDVQVVNGNDAPILANAIADQVANEDAAFNFVVPATAFSDADTGDTLTFAATLADGTALPAWLSFDAATRTFSGTPGNAQVGTLAITITATDVAGASVSDVFNLQITNTNDAPTVNIALADQSATEDIAFSFVVPATAFKDIDVGDTMTFTAALENGAPLPSWLLFNGATRTFSGTPRNAQVGSLSIKVTATDGAGLAVSDVFAVAVTNTNDAPIVNSAIADQAAIEDAAFSFVVPATAFKDVDAGDTLTLTATMAGGAALPAWLSFNAATRTFHGTPANAQVGTLSITVTATDAAGASVSDVFDLQIANTNDAPTVADSDSDQVLLEDSSFFATLPANVFADIDAGDALTWSATLPDGGPLPAWLSFNAATRSFSGLPTNADVGVLSINITATDRAGASVTDVVTLTVANVNDAPMLVSAIADQHVAEDAEFTFVVPAASFVDVDAGDTLALTATLSNGGARSPTWLSFNAATRTFSGTPSNADVGALSVRVTATDGAGAIASDVFDLAVANANDAPVLVTPAPDVSAQEEVTFSVTLPANMFADVDAGDSLVLSVRLANGSPLPSWLTFDPTSRVISGMPPAGSAATLALDVTATDSQGAASSDVFQLEIAAAPEEPVEQYGGNGDDVLTGGSGNDLLYGENGKDILIGNDGNDYLVGGSGNDDAWGGNGNDVVQAQDGLDTIHGGNGNDLIDAGVANDFIFGGSGRDWIAGGGGNDVIDAGADSNLFAFNRGDGADLIQNSVSGSDIISLGMGIRYADLVLSKSDNNLVLDLGQGDAITLADWYLDAAHQGVARLQVVTVGGDYDAASADITKNNKVEIFDFSEIVASFDAARAAAPSISQWAVMGSLLDAHLSGSDSAAVGGDLSYQYAVNGGLGGIALGQAQNVLGSSTFNSATLQALHTRTELEQGTVKLV